MEIRIISLRLRNFKGVRNAEYHFGGHNARIEGPNGSGKSTVFDAFTWLLFGKDHRDQTADTFEIKTIDPATGRPYPREDHWVEAELTVDGQAHTLRRCWVENWVKPTGEIEDVMKGHTSAFFVDGVDVGTKRAYDDAVGGWMQEAVFKLLTNPHYFIDDAFTPWRNRRKALMDLVKDAPERSRVREEFADVVGKLSGRSIEEYRKRISMEKAANKRDLTAILSRIDGMREALPDAADLTSYERKLHELAERRDRALAEIKSKVAEIDRAIASEDEADAARKAENAAIWAEITKLQLKMGNYTSEATKAAIAQNGERQELILRLSSSITEAETKKRSAQERAERARRAIEPLEQDRGRMAGELAAMGEQYKKEKEKAFEYTADKRCPCCGQDLPAEKLEEAEKNAYDNFIKQRQAVVDIILTKARAMKENIVSIDARIAETHNEIAKADEERTAAEAKVKELCSELKRQEAQPQVDVAAIEARVQSSDEYRAMMREELDLRAKALKTSTRPEGLEELVLKRKELERQAAYEVERYTKAELDAKEALSVGKVREDQLKLIAQKENEAKNFADALASCERQEARAAEFVKAEIDSVETAIGNLFHTARWKMFDRTIDGGIVETCEVCDPDGTPYRSMNDAMKILCGIDCIRVFSHTYGSVAPIFIDNAEGILKESFDTTAQVIRLVVKDTEKITLITE